MLWLGSTGALAGFVGLLGADVLDVAGTDMFLLVSAVAAYATAVWGVALVWTLLGWRGLLEPRRLAMAGGAAAMFFGAMMALPSYPGITLGLVTAVAVVTAAVVLRDLLLLAVGAMLVATGLYVARQRRATTCEGHHGPRSSRS